MSIAFLPRRLLLWVLTTGFLFPFATLDASPGDDKRAELRKRVYHVEPAGPLLLASTELGLSVLSASDPAQPTAIAEIEFPGSVVSTTFASGLAWVCAGPYGLVSVDLFDPRRPRKVGHLDTAGSASQVVVRGKTACLADGSMGILVLDVSDPAAPRELKRIATEDYARGVALSGQTLVTAEDRAGVRVLDVRDPARPEPVVSLALPGQARAVIAQEDVVYVALGTAGVGAVQLSPVPRLLWTIPTQDTARGLALHGKSHLVVAVSSAGFNIYSLQETPPRLLSTTPGTEAPAVRVAVVQDYLYVSFDYGGLYVYDVKNPLTPMQYPSGGHKGLTPHPPR